MNNDRELLEQAAKAVGIEWASTGEGFADGYWKFSDGKTQSWWNPLTDDGDALRLSVKLLIELNHNHFQQTVDAWYSPNFSQHTIKLTEAYGDDPYAATRRAIVRAAAEIGKELP